MTLCSIHIISYRKLVFVPGGTITLGWEQFSEGLDEDNLAELNYILGECEYKGAPENFIRKDMAPVRQVTISPMLVGFLPCSPHRKPEVQEDDLLNGDYDFYRPIIRVEIKH